MSLYKTIEEYNTHLIDNQVNINITGEALQGPEGRLILLKKLINLNLRLI